MSQLPMIVGATVLGLLLGRPLVLLARRFQRTASGEPRPLAVVVTSLATGAAFLTLSLAQPLGPFLVTCLLFAAGGIALAVVDIVEKRLPNRLIGLVALAVSVALAATAMLAGDGAGALRALVGAAVMFAIYLTLALASRGSLGMGDVKLAPLAALLPAYESWTAWLVALVAGVLLHAAATLIALATGRAGRRSMIPMGPAMVAGSVLAVALF